ncbi:uncharacterized protein LOC110104339 [Dendrobium catenatum]|uniref:Low-temperature-induced 65 kDa protein n=1 Tax=Dendrobium catenatum TaxID=906689 RepID=A0A2I0VMA4_9ASPA|nr:uncharacterized protein LOC110104339 [Dendrobium catenatum]PKU64544.1 Low-temperature-induced 65 kDa protein [Dendrobium catenatum]
MDPVTAPSSTTPFRSSEQEEEHHEKKPVLKKVMDKVKKIKKVIRKKTPGHGNGGDDDDHAQRGDLDEGDEEFEEEEEINTDPAIHGFPTAGVNENQAKPRFDPETNRGFEQTREYESPATGLRTGANEISGGKVAERGGNGLGLMTEKFVGDLALPGTEAEANSGIEQSRAYESPATGLRSTADELRGGGGEGAEGGDSLGVIKEDSVEDPALQLNENPVTGARTGANEVRRGGEAATGVDNGFGLNTKDFVQDPAEPRTDDELNTRTEQGRVNLSPKTGSRAGLNDLSGGVAESAEGVGDDLGVINMELVEDPAAPKTEAELNSQKEQSRGGEEMEVSPELSRSLEAMALSTQNDGGETELSKDKSSSYTGMVSSAASKVYEKMADAGSAVISKVKPGARKEGGHNEAPEKQSGEEVDVSPELSRSMEALTVSSKNDGGETKLPKDQNSSYTGMISSAASTVYGKMADAGTAVISKVKPDSRNEESADEAVEKKVGEKDEESPELSRSLEATTVSSHNDGGETQLPKDKNSSYTGMVTSAASKVYEKMADAGTAVISKVKPDARNAGGEDKAVEKQGGTEVDVSPELSRSPEGLTISSQNDRGETEPLKDQNSSYTGMVSSAASKVYGIVSDAGTAVISKVKPDAKKEGEDEAVEKQGKGISIKDYITEKLTPGEDEKALSELITEAGQKRKNEAVELPPPVKTGSDDAGSGVGVVGRIRETVTSFLGGGGGSPKSPATEAQRKVIEEDGGFHGRPAEAISQEKRSSEELPTSFH